MHGAYLWAEIAVGIVVVLGALVKVADYIDTKFQRHLTDAVMPAVRDEVRRQLKPVVTELSPNSGTSMRDRLVRLDEWRPTVENRLDKQDRALEGITRRVDNLKDGA